MRNSAEFVWASKCTGPALAQPWEDWGGGMYKLACGNSVDGVLVVVGVEVKSGPPAEQDIIDQILTHMKN